MKTKLLLLAMFTFVLISCSKKDDDNYQLHEPTGLIGRQVGNKVELTWNKVQGAKKYYIYRNNLGLEFCEATTYIDKSPLEGENAYAVSAHNDGNFSSPAVVRVKFEKTDSDNNGNTDNKEYYIKHSWGSGLNADWLWRSMSKQSNGNYSYTGAWGGIGANINTVADDINALWFPEDVISGSTNLNIGDNVTFVYNPNNSSLSVSKNGGGSTTTKPNTPNGLLASTLSSYIKLSWNSVSGAQSYNVYRATSASGSYYKLTSTNTTSYTDYSVTAGTTYYYKVSAVNSAGESSMSSYVSAKIESGGSGTTIPSSPSGLSANASSSSISLNWNSVSGAQSYNIYRSTYVNSSYSKISSSYSTNYTDYSATAGTTYYYKVSAVNSAGESSMSSYASAKIESSGGGTTSTKLSAPTNLEAYGTSTDNFVQISFDQVSLAQSYDLYRSKSPNSGYSKITSTGGYLSGGKYSLTDSKPLTGTSYYKVKAIAPTSSLLNLQDSDLSDYVKVTR